MLNWRSLFHEIRLGVDGAARFITKVQYCIRTYTITYAHGRASIYTATSDGDCYDTLPDTFRAYVLYEPIRWLCAADSTVLTGAPTRENVRPLVYAVMLLDRTRILAVFALADAHLLRDLCRACS